MSSSDDDFLIERINTVYLVSCMLFVMSIERLSHRATAGRGNLYGIIGMTLTIAATLFYGKLKGFYFSFSIPVGVGAIIGIFSAISMAIARMPEYIAFMHSLIGISSVLAGFSNVIKDDKYMMMELILASFEVLIGTITFVGSAVAFIKFNHWLEKPMNILGCARHIINLTLLGLYIASVVLLIITKEKIFLVFECCSAFFLGLGTVRLK